MYTFTPSTLKHCTFVFNVGAQIAKVTLFHEISCTFKKEHFHFQQGINQTSVSQLLSLIMVCFHSKFQIGALKRLGKIAEGDRKNYTVFV